MLLFIKWSNFVEKLILYNYIIYLYIGVSVPDKLEWTSNVWYSRARHPTWFVSIDKERHSPLQDVAALTIQNFSAIKFALKGNV